MTKPTFVDIILLVAVVLLFALVFVRSIKHSEANECVTWQGEAREYKGFFLAKWQQEQCEAIGIPVVLKKK